MHRFVNPPSRSAAVTDTIAVFLKVQPHGEAANNGETPAWYLDAGRSPLAKATLWIFASASASTRLGIYLVRATLFSPVSFQRDYERSIDMRVHVGENESVAWIEQAFNLLGNFCTPRERMFPILDGWCVLSSRAISFFRRLYFASESYYPMYNKGYCIVR